MKKIDMELNIMGLLNSLISLINGGEENASDVTIAKYLLENYNRLQDLNIYDIAEQCYVDRSTIRRLSKKLGFDNFKDLKKQFADFSIEYASYRSGINNGKPGNTVVQQITNMAKECENFFDDKRTEAIIQEMHQASQIVFLTFDVYSRQSSEFQKAMILSGKMVRVITSKFENNEILPNLKDNDMLIVISLAGHFVSQVSHLIVENKAKKILLTTVRNELYNTIFDEIWYLSSSPKLEKRSVYTVYATQYCLEKLFAAYIKKYKQ